MARVTAAEVKAILDDTELSDSVITTFITSANALVTQVLGSSTLGTSLLKEIERWLSAHMVTMTRERAAIEEGAGGAKVRYVGVYGEGLKMTPYGQMVLELDTTGGFASLGAKSVKMFAVQSFED